jgi:hypothetical protein
MEAQRRRKMGAGVVAFLVALALVWGWYLLVLFSCLVPHPAPMLFCGPSTIPLGIALLILSVLTGVIVVEANRRNWQNQQKRTHCPSCQAAVMKDDATCWRCRTPLPALSPTPGTPPPGT